MVMLLFALPDAASFDVGHLSAPACGTCDSVGPAEIGEEVDAGVRIGKIPDGLSQGLRE